MIRSEYVSFVEPPHYRMDELISKMFIGYRNTIAARSMVLLHYFSRYKSSFQR